MKLSTSAIIEEYTNVLNGYVGLYSYRLTNLCIKADPMSLLGVTVEIEGLTMNIEDVAYVGTCDDEYKLRVYPKDEEYMLLVGKGIAEEHVEFRQEIGTIKDDEDIEIRFIELTMPEVNEERKKVMTDAVKVLHDDCVARLKASDVLYMGKLTLNLAGATEEDVEAAKKKYEEQKEMFEKACEEITDNKNREIEEAYVAYLEKKVTEDEARNEADAAAGKSAKNNLKY